MNCSYALYVSSRSIVWRRLRETTAQPFAVGNNGIELAKAIFQRAELAYDPLAGPFFLRKYKDQLAEFAKGILAILTISCPYDSKRYRREPQTLEEEKRALDEAGARH